MMEFIEIDGSEGEGGGQILRSSLALSLLTGRSFRIRNIRAKRSRPGLLRQHLTAVQAAAEIGQARLIGDSPGSLSLEFVPGAIRGGEYHFQIGTAGSAMLVLQTILPVLILADKPSKITLSGGTHNPQAPPFDFFVQTFIPLIERMGPAIRAKIHRYGFYPAGGGELEVEIDPVRSLKSFALLDRGDLLEKRAEILITGIPYDIAQREANTIRDQDLWSDAPINIRKIPSSGPGNIVQIFLKFENITESFNAIAEKGKRAEDLVRNMFRNIGEYIRSDVPVGIYTADQIMLPMAIAAVKDREPGKFRTLPLSNHSRTHIDLIRKFLDLSIGTEEEPAGNVCVSFNP
ncbi:MAG: RNA 3'-terminal phosphate cyclase [Planctomycetia bacterium]|nr:RNA 3'-terminal phosphate cyclase [Planctomycetia bacterium]